MKGEGSKKHLPQSIVKKNRTIRIKLFKAP